jgi:hypothetical protein
MTWISHVGLTTDSHPFGGPENTNDRCDGDLIRVVLLRTFCSRITNLVVRQRCGGERGARRSRGTKGNTRERRSPDRTRGTSKTIRAKWPAEMISGSHVYELSRLDKIVQPAPNEPRRPMGKRADTLDKDVQQSPGRRECLQDVKKRTTGQDCPACTQRTKTSDGQESRHAGQRRPAIARQTRVFARRQETHNWTRLSSLHPTNQDVRWARKPTRWTKTSSNRQADESVCKGGTMARDLVTSRVVTPPWHEQSRPDEKAPGSVRRG